MEDNSEILKTGVVKSKVAKGLKMSIQSVTKALQELVDAKIIKEVVSEYGYTHYEIEIIHAERGSDLEGFEVLFFDPSEYWYHRNNDIRDRINNLVDAYNEWENRSKDKQK